MHLTLMSVYDILTVSIRSHAVSPVNISQHIVSELFAT